MAAQQTPLLEDLKQKYVMRHNTCTLIERLLEDDPTLEILKLSNYEGNATADEMCAIFTALQTNTTVKVLYVQNQTVDDTVMAVFIEALKCKRIWAANIGEWSGVTSEGYDALLRAIPDTNLCFMYVGEPGRCSLTQAKKKRLKSAVKANARRYTVWCSEDGAIAKKVTGMWFNPTSSKFLEHVAKKVSKGKLYGTALFNNDGHGSEKGAKLKVRSKMPRVIVDDSNRKAGKGWQDFTVATINEHVLAELDDFHDKAAAYIKRIAEQEDEPTVTTKFQGVKSTVSTAAALTYSPDGTQLLMATLPLSEIWETHLDDVAKL